MHYEITRMNFVPPKPLFDARGVPTNKKFDVMLSYQWDSQAMVRGICYFLVIYFLFELPRHLYGPRLSIVQRVDGRTFFFVFVMFKIILDFKDMGRNARKYIRGNGTGD